MASCAYCNTTILIGGKRQGDLRFCNVTCAANGALVEVANQLPLVEVMRYAQQVHGGNCPRCGGQGPADVHTSYRVWSALVMTNWSSRPAISCQSCGTKRKIGDAFFSLFLGWWGFPWGLLMTPVQLGRNLIGLFQATDPSQPSPALERMLRLQLAQHKMSAPQVHQRKDTALL
jgi:hypothetical protein